MSTNAIDRIARTRNPSVVQEVDSITDLPPLVLAPDGVMRTPIDIGVQYVVQSTFVWPPILWPAEPGIGFRFTEILGDSQNVAMLVAGNPGAHIWGRGTGNIRLNNVVIFDVSNGGLGFGATLFDLVGQSTDIDPIQRQNALFIKDTGLVAFAKFGRVVDISVAVLSSGWVARKGLVVRSVNGNIRQISDPFSHVSVGVPMETPMLSYQGPQTISQFSGGSLALGPGDSSFAIDSAAGGIYEIALCPFGGSPAFGNFFRPDISESITKFDPADVAFASVTDSSVNPSVDSTIRFSGIQKFVVGQVVRAKGNTGTTYDGLHAIVRVSLDEMGFDINVAFGATDTGAIQFTRVTAVGHGLADGETNTITGTTNYNDTTNMFEVDDDNFDIPTAFVGDDATGTVSSQSKNETSIGVTTTVCGLQPDSKSIGSLHATDNTLTTTISTRDVWVDLDLDTAVVSSSIQRWEMADAAIGELRYLGRKEFDGYATAAITAMSFAAIQQFQFRVLVDDAPTADAEVFGIELKANTESICLFTPVKLNTNGRVRIQARNRDGTSDLDIQQFSMRIQ